MRALRTVDACVVWLDVGAHDFAAVDDEGVALATVVAEDGAAIEGEVESFGKFAGGVTEEADAGFAVRIEGLAPRGHAVSSGYVRGLY